MRGMVGALAHRGPDADGVFVDENVSFGHNRLSIIDLSTAANQPMRDHTGELTIVFNGEIYNFRELKKELEGKYNFVTASDTEVILAAYRTWGKEVVNKLNGMFAFAIWDKRTQEIFCARDHAGIKPLYYYWDGDRFIFASEIKAILTHNIPRALNKDAFNQYLRVLYVPEPQTMFVNIFKLPPQSTLTLKGKTLSVARYDSSARVASPGSYQEGVGLLRDKVLRAVKRQLVADVPVGVYLSGGIDSSVVLCSMAQQSTNIQAFSVGFALEEGEEREKFNSDLELAKKTAGFFGAEHNVLLVSAKDARASFEEAVAQCDDPVSNPTSVAMLLLARFAKQKVSVVLTGSGGDELFGGYDRYRMALVAQQYAKLPTFVRSVASALNPKLAKLNYKDNVDLFARFMFEKDERLSSVVSPLVFIREEEIKRYFAERYFSSGTNDPAASLMQADQYSWLPDYFFMLSDKMSMASALEERVPLTDKELVAFSDALPRSHKMDLFRTKKVLKDAFRDDLPPFLFAQPKRGWFSPGAKWLRNKDFSAFAKDVLSPEYYEGTKTLFVWPEAEYLLQAHVQKERYNLTLLWALLTFQIWARHYRIKV